MIHKHVKHFTFFAQFNFHLKKSVSFSHKFQLKNNYKTDKLQKNKKSSSSKLKLPTFCWQCQFSSRVKHTCAMKTAASFRESVSICCQSVSQSARSITIDRDRYISFEQLLTIERAHSARFNEREWLSKKEKNREWRCGRLLIRFAYIFTDLSD